MPLVSFGGGCVDVAFKGMRTGLSSFSEFIMYPTVKVLPTDGGGSGERARLRLRSR